MSFDKVISQITQITHGRIRGGQVLTDFFAYGALLLSTRTDPVHREDRLKQLQGLKRNYQDSEWDEFYQGLIQLCDEVVANTKNGYYRDLLTEPYQKYVSGIKALKQNFSPIGVGQVLSRTIAAGMSELPEAGYFKLSDTACGSGILLLAAADQIQMLGFNPTCHLVVQAVDRDIRCVHMTYLHLSLYGIPAVVIHGDSLTVKEYSRWYTPVYLMNKWVWREPLLFGGAGKVSTELLKRIDEPLYGAYRRLNDNLIRMSPDVRQKQNYTREGDLS